MDPVSFRGKRIFITGGTGYLGSLLLRRLKGKSVVTALTRNPDRFRSERPELLWPELTLRKGEIEDLRFETDAAYDYVIHGGNPADLPTDPEGRAAFRRTALEGTARLLEGLDRLANRPKRILLMSSGAVYGPQPPEVAAMGEDRDPFPGDPYGESKRAVEILMSEYGRTRGVGVGVARIFACAGAYLPLSGRFALGQFIAAARDGAEIRILSDGTPKRSYLEGNELSDWILALLAGRANRESEIETYNVGSDDAITIREVADAVADVFRERGKTIRLSVATPDSCRPASPSYIPDVGRIAREYGLKPKKSSTQAVREATEWALNET